MFIVKRYEKNNKINRKYCEKPILKKYLDVYSHFFPKKTNKKTKNKTKPKQPKRNCKTVFFKIASCANTSIFYFHESIVEKFINKHLYSYLPITTRAFQLEKKLQ